jgi:peptide/nickel transport system substrate-binding protein
MRNRARAAVTVVIAGLLTAGVAACGSSSSSSSGSGTPKIPLKAGENPVGQQLYGKTKGGTLTAYSSEDFEHLDPGQAYFVQDYLALYATQRMLFVYPPNSSSQLVPDLATAVPSLSNGGITDGGKTVTVHIEHGVHFSPPVNREVTSKDVAYAVERAANPNVANPYFAGYFGSATPAPLVGAESPKYSGSPIPGITTPDKYTIVFKMTKPGAATLIPALQLPISAPVPEEFAGPMDKHSPTTYGAQQVVATGPYMFKSDKTGKFAGIGYQTGKSATLVRNPNWSPSTYTSAFRPPAYLDQININIGGDASVIGQQVLKGTHAVQLDTPTQSVVKLAYQTYPSQITFTPGSGDHYIGVDTQHGPFKNVNIRRAFWAQLDRLAIQKLRGGPLVGVPATHFIYPGNGAAFDQSGGYPGPQVDYNKNLGGDHTVACKYMKLAGYPNCKYTGSATIQMVGANNGNDPAIMQNDAAALTALGFKVHVSPVDQSVMYAKYCGVPKQQIDACPTVGWVRDFADPLSVLYVPFYGPAITSTNNSNWSQFNNPQVNAAMQQAALVVDPAARAQAWANVDKMLVDQAAAIPEDFDNQANVRSKDTAGVNDIAINGNWDMMFTSLN